MNIANGTTLERLESPGGLELRPPPAMSFRVTEDDELERLKARLLRERLATVATADLNVRLRRAANEAAALAFVTRYPLLVFPELFEEKARTASQQAARQLRVRSRSRELLAA